MGTLDSVIFSGLVTKPRRVPHNYPEDLTQSSIIKYFGNKLDDETRKHMSHIFRSCMLGEEKKEFQMTTRIKEKFLKERM